MTKEREALKLAQRALSNKNASNETIYKALAAIKEALAQPVQEPTSDDYALGYAEGFNDACKKPAQEPVARGVLDDGQIDWTAEYVCTVTIRPMFGRLF